MGKLIVGVNDLATVHPELLNEWDYEKNDKNGIFPNEIAYGSGKKVYWKCSVCNHEWFASPNQLTNRKTNGNHCAVCSNQIVKKGYNDLVTLRPDLVAEWDYEENNNLNPDDYTCGSKIKVHWKCKVCNHKWVVAINSRAGKKNTGCPKCGVKKRAKSFAKAKKGESLEDKYPDLVKEWDYKNNGELLPSMVKPYSSKKVFWKCCRCGNSWNTKISNRTKKKQGCPKCNSVFGSSIPEQAVFYFLGQINPHVLNRYKLYDKYGMFELDVFLPDRKIGIEYDGKFYHNSLDKINKDKFKEERLKEFNITLYRILESNENKVVDNYIYYNYCNNNKICEENLTWAIKILFEKLGYGNLFVDFRLNRLNILEMYYKNEVLGSLSVVNPKLAKEWNYKKNGNLLPTQVKPFSKQKVWWICKNNHDYFSEISVRSSGSGCPYCSNKKVLTGFNDLATVYPNLVKEWDYEANGNLLPTQIVYGSHLKIGWKCSKGHSWESTIDNRIRKNTGCPYCSGRYPIVGETDLETLRPDLIIDWDYEENDKLLPYMFTLHSNKIVSWKCHVCGHKWRTSVNLRSNGTGCSKCSSIKRRKIRSLPKVGCSLADKYPELIEEWDSVLNEGLTPFMVGPGSTKRVWWKCKKCGHSWNVEVYSRTSGGHGCPECAKNKRKKK